MSRCWLFWFHKILPEVFRKHKNCVQPPGTPKSQSVFYECSKPTSSGMNGQQECTVKHSSLHCWPTKMSWEKGMCAEHTVTGALTADN